MISASAGSVRHILSAFHWWVPSRRLLDLPSIKYQQDHLRGFTSQVGNMTDALLALSPPITGLDRTIVISPARLHLTLGVMALDDSPTSPPTASTGTSAEPGALPPRKTVLDAVNLLQRLKPDILQMLDGQPIQLTLDDLTVMRRSPAGEADVLYLGPSSALAKTEEHVRSVGLLHGLREISGSRFYNRQAAAEGVHRFRTC
ncbi:hypothetical protein FRC10_008175 [Ceratobasidium sp. 414]|nr:hypothetical protein FRC10_008175 [Ceratobasidium sp. 414]